MTREEAIRIIETVFQDEYVYKYYDSITHQALDMAIEALSAGSVEVVRCKDCETIDENGWCEFVNGYVHDGFCAWGKRKGGEEE